MKKAAIALVLMVGFASPAAAQGADLQDEIVAELPGLELTLDEFIPEEPTSPAGWQKIFRSGNNVVSISVQDFGPDSGLVLANAWRVAANGYEVAYENLYTSQGVELGTPFSSAHEEHPGVRVTERSFDGRTYFIAQYLEGSNGFVIVAVLEDNSLFEAVLAAQLEQSTGPRIDWEGNGGVLSADGAGDDGSGGQGGGSAGVIFLGVIVIAVLAGGGLWLMGRNGDAETGDGEPADD